MAGYISLRRKAEVGVVRKCIHFGGLICTVSRWSPNLRQVRIREEHTPEMLQ
jgi:hypothetical protein